MAHRRHILLISNDRGTEQELQAALSADDDGLQLSSAPNVRQAVEELKRRQFAVIVIEIGADPEQLIAAAKALGEVSPDSILVATFRPESISAATSEGDLFIRAVRAGVRDFLQRPLSAVELAGVLSRLDASAHSVNEPRGRVISFVSTKGGVGKSTLAVNTACGLAMRHPGKVVLIDGSLQLGVCAAMLDLTPKSTLADLVGQQQRLDATLLREFAERHPCGLDLIAAPEDAIAAADVDADLMGQVLNLARKTYDFVVVDTFPVFDPIVIEILDASDRTYLVVENVVPTLLGCSKLLELLKKLDVSSESVRVVLNRYLRLPGGLTPADAAQRLARHVDHVFPYDRRLLIAANTGHPFATSAPRWNRFGRELASLVRELSDMKVSPASRNGVASLKGAASSTTRESL